MLLTIRNVDDELVQKAKLATGKTSGSQAFIAGVEKMLRQTDQIQSLKEEVDRLKQALARNNQVMRELAPLCIEVHKIAAQDDLFASR